MKTFKSSLRVGVVGINHKLAELNLREILAKICQKRFGAGQSTHGAHSFILLSTCNRMEIYFSSNDLPETHSYLLNVLNQEVAEEFDQKLYSYFGQECFNHLASVAAGLDSAIIAETEIQGQVKQAYESTFGYNSLPSSLHYLFQKSLKISKKIRDKYALGRGMPNLEDAILEAGTQHLGKKPHSILFIGASDINQKVLYHFQKKGLSNITLCNRSLDKGEAISARFQIPFLPWNELCRWQEFDWIILGTKSPKYLIQNIDLPNQKKLIIDLSFPRNVDPAIVTNSPVQLFNVDQINQKLQSRRKLLDSALADAQREIQLAVQLHTELFQRKQLLVKQVAEVA